MRMEMFRESIVYEDGQILICHKPPGVPVQSARVGVMDLECACRNYLRTAHIGIVQRLDQPVEGLVVLAKTKKAAGELGRQVQDGRMEKTYLAVAHGAVEPPEGMFTDWLVRDGQKRMAAVVPPGAKNAKEARLRYQVVERRGGMSLLKIRLLTGRFHQIRVQFASRGCPLVGDRKYGPQYGGGEKELGLCAYRLGLIHPVSGKEMYWEIRPKGSAFRGYEV